MKLVIVPIFLFLLFTQTISQWLLVGEYRLNQAYIAKNLCINRERPKLHCNGKCQLMKKMAEEEQQNPGSKGGDTRLKVQEVIFIHQSAACSLEIPTTAFTIKYGLVTWPLFNTDPTPIFHPPGRV